MAKSVADLFRDYDPRIVERLIAMVYALRQSYWDMSAESDSEVEDADADADADAVSVPQIMVIAPDGTNTHIIDPTIDELPDSSANARADAQTRSDEEHLSLLMRKAKFSE